MKLAEASLFIAGDTIRLAPAALVGEEGQGAQLEGEYNIDHPHLERHHLRTRVASVEPRRLPLVNRFQGGKWSAPISTTRTTTCQVFGQGTSMFATPARAYPASPLLYAYRPRASKSTATR